MPLIGAEKQSDSSKKPDFKIQLVCCVWPFWPMQAINNQSIH